VTEIPDRNDPAFWDWMGEAQKEHHSGGAPVNPLKATSWIVKATICGVASNDAADIPKMAIGTPRFSISTKPQTLSVGGLRVSVPTISTYEFEGYLKEDDFNKIIKDPKFLIRSADWKLCWGC